MAGLLTSRKLKLSTKIRIVKCYVYSLFCYGCESWTLSKVLEAKIEALEMYCFRRLGNVKWRDKVTNDCVIQKLQTKRTLLNDIQKRKLRYYGHIKRRKRAEENCSHRKTDPKADLLSRGSDFAPLCQVAVLGN